MRLLKRLKVQSTGSLVDVMIKDAFKPHSGERFSLLSTWLLATGNQKCEICQPEASN